MRDFVFARCVRAPGVALTCGESFTPISMSEDTMSQNSDKKTSSARNSGRVFASVFAVVLVAVPVCIYLWVGSLWAAGVGSLAVAIVGTTIPIILALLHKVEIDKAPVWIENTDRMGDQYERVKEHYGRLKGTLIYWKNEAAAYHRLDMARVIWSLLSAVALPVLVQYYDSTDPWANAFLTVLTTWTGLIVSLAYTLKAEQKYQGMRQQESDFYDIARQLLDHADPNDSNLGEKVDEYIRKVEAIRQTARKVETASPPSALDFRR